MKQTSVFQQRNKHRTAQNNASAAFRAARTKTALLSKPRQCGIQQRELT
jgi:hypothetical protein